jgi:sugar O-acyltransferase (sialic acid O-acetyltransferase NeuD family)
MKKIAVFGAGGFGREVALLIEQINFKAKEWDITGFYDDGVTKGKELYGYKVLGGVEEVNKVEEELYVIYAIADPSTKRKLISKVINKNILYPVLIHPTVLLGHKDVTIGEGTIIAAGTILTVNIQIGAHVILNLSNTVGHDTFIENYCSFMPSVNISGEVQIAEGVYVGTGAKIINQLEIGANTIVGAGAVVSKSLPANCTAVGVPAKPIKFHE